MVVCLHQALGVGGGGRESPPYRRTTFQVESAQPERKTSCSTGWAPLSAPPLAAPAHAIASAARKMSRPVNVSRA